MSDWSERGRAFSLAKEEVLLALREASKGRSNPYILVQNIRLTGSQMVEGFEGVLVGELVDSGFLKRLKDIEYGGPRPFAKLNQIDTFLDVPAVSLTNVGLNEIGGMLEDENSHIAKIYQGESNYQFLTGHLAGNKRAVPASDRTIRLNHNSAEYQEISSALDEAVKLADATKPNGVSGDQHASLIAGLRAARELWKSYELTRLQSKVGILMALEKAEKQLKISFMMARGSLLVEAIKTVLGIG